MLKSESLIAFAMMALSVYFMVHATVLPIGWVRESGPGGGAFPFWLSLGMLLVSGGILVKSLRSGEAKEPFFDPEMLRPILLVVVALTVTVILIPIAGAYIALPLFMIWSLKVRGGHGWVLTGSLTVGTALFLFFFFEVTLKILLPKGFTEPLFFPLYAMFF